MIGYGNKIAKEMASMAQCGLQPDTLDRMPEATRAINVCSREIDILEKQLNILEDKIARILESPNPDCPRESEPPMCTALGRDIQELYQRLSYYNEQLDKLISRINI
jgi:hypothetical protein